MTIPARIIAGNLVPNPILLRSFHAKHGDGDYEIVITKRGEGKTARQLRYIHGPVVGAISEHLGYSTKDIKAYLKREFGVKVERIDPMTAEIYEEPKSFADYTKDEMRMFLDEVIQFASEIGIFVPIPEDLR